MTIYFLELSNMKKTIWALLDSRMGSVNVIRGVLQQFSADEFDIVEKQIVYTPLAKLPNFIKGASCLGLTGESKKGLSAPFPDLVISGTRRTASVARWIKKKSKGSSKIVQMLHPGPGAGLSDFDAIFVPEHDKGKKYSSNIVYTVGSPTRTSAKAMTDARAKWEPVFNGLDLPRPWTTVIVGGAVKGKPFTLENARAFAEEVLKLKQEIGGSILITDSWRTGEKPREEIMNILKNIPAYTYLWGEKKENPYMGYLACADNIIVTGDSVSMTCESCGTGVPVYVFCGQNWLTPKQLRFVQSLYDNGYAIACDNPQRAAFSGGKKLNAASEVADKIRSLF